MNDLKKDALVALAERTAACHNLDPGLVCAVVEQESAWNPWAVRFEPIFETRYIRPALPSAPTTEELCLAISWGLMQVMGQTAREHGFSGKFLSELSDPEVGLSVGCAVLTAKLNKARGDTGAGLLLWNGGANTKYPEQVMARIPRYRSCS